MLNPTERNSKHYHRVRITCLFILFCISLMFITLTDALAVEKTWDNGAPDNKWESADNWDPPGEPGDGDDVTIPPDQGSITVNGTKTLKSLIIQDSESVTPTTIKPEAANGGSVEIVTTGNVEVGSNSRIEGGDGATEQAGGAVKITAGGGFINKGWITGGNGSSGGVDFPGYPGGEVKVIADNIDNSEGNEVGGNGGDSGQYGNGAVGGKVTNYAVGEGNKVSGEKTKKGGTGGVNLAGEKAADGEVDMISAGDIEIFPGDYVCGHIINVEVNYGDTVFMAGITENTFDADYNINFTVSSEMSKIDLTGIPAGTNVIQSDTGQITFYVLSEDIIHLDSGVTLADITEPDAIVHIVTGVPTLSEWGMLIMGLLLLTAGTIAVIRRKKAALRDNQ